MEHSGLTFDILEIARVGVSEDDVKEDDVESADEEKGCCHVSEPHV